MWRQRPLHVAFTAPEPVAHQPQGLIGLKSASMPQHAMPVLVKSALAKFPSDAPSDWRVKLQQDKASGVPNVISVKPLPQ